jgi:hypothetical protein
VGGIDAGGDCVTTDGESMGGLPGGDYIKTPCPTMQALNGRFKRVLCLARGFIWVLALCDCRRFNRILRVNPNVDIKVNPDRANPNRVNPHRVNPDYPP